MRCCHQFKGENQKQKQKTGLCIDQEYWNECKTGPFRSQRREDNWNWTELVYLQMTSIFLSCYHFSIFHIQRCENTGGIESWATGYQSFPLKLKFFLRVLQLAFVISNLPKVYFCMVTEFLQKKLIQSAILRWG